MRWTFNEFRKQETPKPYKEWPKVFFIEVVFLRRGFWKHHLKNIEKMPPDRNQNVEIIGGGLFSGDASCFQHLLHLMHNLYLHHLT